VSKDMLNEVRRVVEHEWRRAPDRESLRVGNGGAQRRPWQRAAVHAINFYLYT
jgi:hypothetical protein